MPRWLQTSILRFAKAIIFNCLINKSCHQKWEPTRCLHAPARAWPMVLRPKYTKLCRIYSHISSYKRVYFSITHARQKRLCSAGCVRDGVLQELAEKRNAEFNDSIGRAVEHPLADERSANGGDGGGFNAEIARHSAAAATFSTKICHSSHKALFGFGEAVETHAEATN